MSGDQSLVASAQMLAGRHIHTVAQKLIVYELGCDLLDKDRTMDSEQRARTQAIVDEAEDWLRRFVARSHATC